MDILWIILVGAIAGWLAGIIVQGSGFGLLRDIVIGVVGAIIGRWLFMLVGIGIVDPFIGSIVVATVGAVVFVLLLRSIRRS